ncbi:hypothetical protein D3C78_1977850 [compost metagenome]
MPFFIQHAHHHTGKAHIADLGNIMLDNVKIHRTVAKIPTAWTNNRVHRHTDPVACQT